MAGGDGLLGRPKRWLRGPREVLLPPETSLLSLDGFVPPGFQHGLELLNDNRTPMEFVVTALEKSAGLDRRDAVRAMLDVHFKGGKLIPMQTLDEAERAATQISTAAQECKH